jgi:hypothetical protein
MVSKEAVGGFCFFREGGRKFFKGSVRRYNLTRGTSGSASSNDDAMLELLQYNSHHYKIISTNFCLIYPTRTYPNLL